MSVFYPLEKPPFPVWINYTKTACKLQLEILPLADALFCEVNPIPVKYAMNVLGWEAGSCRLPLVEPSDAHKEKIEQALEAEGLIQE